MGEKRGGGFSYSGPELYSGAPWGVAGAGSSRMSECRGAAVGSRKGKGSRGWGLGGWDVSSDAEKTRPKEAQPVGENRLYHLQFHEGKLVRGDSWSKFEPRDKRLTQASARGGWPAATGARPQTRIGVLRGGRL